VYITYFCFRFYRDGGSFVFGGIYIERKLLLGLAVLLLVGSFVFTAGCLDRGPERTVDDFYNAIEMEDNETVDEVLHENSPLQGLFVEFIGVWDITVEEVEQKSIEELSEEHLLLDLFVDDPDELEDYLEMMFEETGLTEEDERYTFVEATITINGEQVTYTHILVEDDQTWQIFI